MHRNFFLGIWSSLRFCWHLFVERTPVSFLSAAPHWATVRALQWDFSIICLGIGPYTTCRANLPFERPWTHWFYYESMLDSRPIVDQPLRIALGDLEFSTMTPGCKAFLYTGLVPSSWVTVTQWHKRRKLSFENDRLSEDITRSGSLILNVLFSFFKEPSWDY